MNRNYLETLVGFIVLIIAVSFAYFAYHGADIRNSDINGYSINVAFTRMDGINVGGDVKISGIKVGTITDAKLDPKTYRADVQLALDENIKIPDDSYAEIISAGLLGDKYIALVPGGSETMIKDGGRIKFSQASVSLEALIGKFMFGSSDGDKKAPEQKDEDPTRIN